MRKKPAGQPFNLAAHVVARRTKPLLPPFLQRLMRSSASTSQSARYKSAIKWPYLSPKLKSQEPQHSSPEAPVQLRQLSYKRFGQERTTRYAVAPAKLRFSQPETAGDVSDLFLTGQIQTQPALEEDTMTGPAEETLQPSMTMAELRQILATRRPTTGQEPPPRPASPLVQHPEQPSFRRLQTKPAARQSEPSSTRPVSRIEEFPSRSILPAMPKFEARPEAPPSRPNDQIDRPSEPEQPLEPSVRSEPIQLPTQSPVPIQRPAENPPAAQDEITPTQPILPDLPAQPIRRESVPISPKADAIQESDDKEGGQQPKLPKSDPIQPEPPAPARPALPLVQRKTEAKTEGISPTRSLPGRAMDPIMQELPASPESELTLPDADVDRGEVQGQSALEEFSAGAVHQEAANEISAIEYNPGPSLPATLPESQRPARFPEPKVTRSGSPGETHSQVELKPVAQPLPLTSIQRTPEIIEDAPSLQGETTGPPSGEANSATSQSSTEGQPATPEPILSSSRPKARLQLARQTAANASRGNTKQQTVSFPVARQPNPFPVRSREREPYASTETASLVRANPNPATSPERVTPVPVPVQRQIGEAPPKTDVVARQTVTTPEVPTVDSVGGDQNDQPVDLDHLARQVYPLIKRRLLIERQQTVRW